MLLFSKMFRYESKKENLGDIQLINVDCISAMQPPLGNSVDLIVVVFPYYKTKGSKWDNQWPGVDSCTPVRTRGDVVLDPFAGSFVLGDVYLNLQKKSTLV